MRAYQQTRAKVTERYEGYVTQYLGDGILVYFGYPTAHEDNAVGAVRPGLEIVAALQKRNVGTPALPRNAALPRDELIPHCLFMLLIQHLIA